MFNLCYLCLLVQWCQTRLAHTTKKTPRKLKMSNTDHTRHMNSPMLSSSWLLYDIHRVSSVKYLSVLDERKDNSVSSKIILSCLYSQWFAWELKLELRAVRHDNERCGIWNVMCFVGLSEATHPCTKMEKIRWIGAWKVFEANAERKFPSFLLPVFLHMTWFSVLQ
jgi:hypothetical protein